MDDVTYDFLILPMAQQPILTGEKSFSNNCNDNCNGAIMMSSVRLPRVIPPFFGTHLGCV